MWGHVMSHAETIQADIHQGLLPPSSLFVLSPAFEMVTTRSKTKSASLIGVMPGTLYVKIWAFMMVGYAAQMLLIPANMVTDHWDIPSTPGMEFWIRGASIGFGCTAYLLTKVDTETCAAAARAQAPSPRPQFSFC